MIRIIITLFGLLILTACSASYEKLKNINTNQENNFSQNLLQVYKQKAIFEAEKMHDWNSAKLYSEKALSALEGKEIKPQKISYWKLPKNKISELNQSYDNLMIIYNEAKIIDPYNLAVAIISLDCWAEQQEENWQTWDINKCRDDFLESMHKIYKNISIKQKDSIDELLENNEKNDIESVSVVTTNDNKEVMQIIYFDFDEALLSEISIGTIKNFIKKYNNKISNYLIVGHADTKGTKEYNLKLSLKRAEAVKNIFLENGIKEKKITILGKGEEFLAVSTGDNVKHPANRRTEISILN